MNEKLIERKLREGVQAAGGLALKWVSPGFTGVPDRIVLMPGGRLWLPETKSTGERLSFRQAFVHKQLRGLGFDPRVIDSEDRLQDFLKEIAK